MPGRPCLTCGRLSPGPRCTNCQRAKKAALYDAEHRRAHKLWRRAINRGGVHCWRCGKPIEPGAAFDLGHRPNATSLPEHPHCNRSAK